MEKFLFVFESCEPRFCRSATLSPTGELHVVGTASNDIVGVAVKSGRLRVDIDGTVKRFTPASVKSILIELSDGNDQLYVASGVIRVYALGEGGGDLMFGGAGDDSLSGGDGLDTLNGGAGNDRLDGGPLPDRLIGGDGNDALYGRDANDNFDGGAGVDRMYGGAGNDHFVAGPSNDRVYGEDGNDSMAGEAGNDLLDAGAGGDTVSGGLGNDTLYGGTGIDALLGGGGANVVAGNGGADRVLRQGDDTIIHLSTTDAVMNFADRDRKWTEPQILQIDQGFRKLQERTGNTKMLKTSDGGEVTLRRRIDLGEDTLAINHGDGRIDVADLAFADDAGIEPYVTVIHELGHNWDTSAENPTNGEFRALSRWRRSAFSGRWTHSPTAVFAREYGETDPFEDFATSLEGYFHASTPVDEWQVKWDYIDRFLDSMKG